MQNSENSDDLKQLFQRASSGDEEALSILWNLLYPRLRTVVGKRIEEMPRLAGEASDLTSTALHRFLTLAAGSPEWDINSLNSVWALLRKIAFRHMSDTLKSRFAAKRGGLVWTFSLENPQSSDMDWMKNQSGDQATARERIRDDRMGEPADQLMFMDLLADLLERLPDDRSRQIVLMRLNHQSTADIAESLKLGLRTVQRNLEKIHDCWLQRLSDLESPGEA
jgi:DNA-directed RNA polymerase specialized sigma24 family protein